MNEHPRQTTSRNPFSKGPRGRYEYKWKKQKQDYLVYVILNDGIHFVFVQSSYRTFSTKQSHVSFWKASCYFWKVLSENFIDVFVCFRFLFKVTLLSIYSATFVSWLVGQTIQTKQMALNGWHLSITAFIWEHRFQPQERYPCCSFDRNFFKCRKGTFFALLRRPL